MHSRENISHILDDNITDSMTTEATPTASGPAATTVSPPSGSTGASYLDDLVGRCGNIPAGIHVDIMYAEAGLAGNWPIYHIVGAKVRWVLVFALTF